MKRILAIGLVVLMLLSTVGCQQTSPKTDETGTQERDSVVVSVPVATENFDPQNHVDLYSYLTDAQVYDTLEYLNYSTGKYELKLAESIEISDDLTKVTVKLKEGVLFHNGEELKASDVKFTFDRAIESPIYGTRVGMLKECNVLDDYTVEIVCKFPYAPMDVFLNGTFIVNEKAVKAQGDDYGNSAEGVVGTGPYKLVSWDKGQTVTFVRNDDYFGEKAGIKNLTIERIATYDTASIALEKGDIDYIYESIESQLETLEANKDIAVTRAPVACVESLYMNLNAAPFNDVNVRKAVAYAVNRDSIAFVAGLGQPHKNFIDSMAFGLAEDVAAPDQNIEKAKEYMALAGYPDGGLSITFIAQEGQGSMDYASVLQADLAEIGIDVKIETLEFNTAVERLFTGEYQLSSLSLSNRFLDCDMFYQWYMTDSSNNFLSYSNEKFDELIVNARSEVNPEKRMEMYRQAQEILLEDMAFIPIYQFDTISPHHKDLGGVEIPTIMASEFRKLYWN